MDVCVEGVNGECECEFECECEGLSVSEGCEYEILTNTVSES